MYRSPICPRVPGRDFDALPSEEDTISFLRDLGHTGFINSLNDVVIDKMHQPWRTFAAIINRSLSGKTSGLDKLCLSRAQILWDMYYQKNVDYMELLWEDFTYQIDNKVYKKQEKILEMKESKAYKTYLGYATGEVPPKVARKFKKASPSKKKSELVHGYEEPVKKGKRLKTLAKKYASKPTTEHDKLVGSYDLDSILRSRSCKEKNNPRWDRDLDSLALHTQVTSLVDSHLDTRLGETRQEFMNFLSESLTARIKE
ncbi:hypothetical protein Tco_0856212 [Tanacetum coccineum]